MARLDQLMRGICLIMAILVVTNSFGAENAAITSQKGQANDSVTVEDAIAFVRLGDPSYFAGTSVDQPCLPSPDGLRCILVLRKGNIYSQINEYSLILFRLINVFASPRPELLLTFGSDSNRDAIHDVKWLADGETLVFLGEKSGKTAQVYEFNLNTRRLKTRTKHSSAINHYDISEDGTEIVFSADSEKKRVPDSTQEVQGIVIRNQNLPEALQGSYGGAQSADELFV